MKFDNERAKETAKRDEASYRKFLAGSKVSFSQAFWENGPRSPGKAAAPSPAEAKRLPGVSNLSN